MAVTNCFYPSREHPPPLPRDDILMTEFPNRVASSSVAWKRVFRVRACETMIVPFHGRDEKPSSSPAASWKWITADGDGNLFGGTTMAERTTRYIGDMDPAVIPPPSPWWQSRVNTFPTTCGLVSVKRCSKMWVTNSAVRHIIQIGSRCRVIWRIYLHEAHQSPRISAKSYLLLEIWYNKNSTLRTFYQVARSFDRFTVHFRLNIVPIRVISDSELKCFCNNPCFMAALVD